MNDLGITFFSKLKNVLGTITVLCGCKSEAIDHPKKVLCKQQQTKNHYIIRRSFAYCRALSNTQNNFYNKCPVAGFRTHDLLKMSVLT